MAGLALGSYLGGRYGRRAPKPLVVYGVAEIVVGAVCAVTPWLFVFLEETYVSAAAQFPNSLVAISVVRALLTGLVVVIPTLAMGVTLPMLSRVVAGPGTEVEGARRRLALLYAINTAGGATGALASAYWVLPWLGVAATMRSAAVINVAIGILAIALGREELPADASSNDDESASKVTGSAPALRPVRRLGRGFRPSRVRV